MVKSPAKRIAYDEEGNPYQGFTGIYEGARYWIRPKSISRELCGEIMYMER